MFPLHIIFQLKCIDARFWWLRVGNSFANVIFCCWLNFYQRVFHIWHEIHTEQIARVAKRRIKWRRCVSGWCRNGALLRKTLNWLKLMVCTAWVCWVANIPNDSIHIGSERVIHPTKKREIGGKKISRTFPQPIFIKRISFRWTYFSVADFVFFLLSASSVPPNTFIYGRQYCIRRR